VTEVVVDHEGHEERYHGDIVVVSCGAANSAKLLLLLGQRRAPARAGQRLGSGWPQLHVPRQPSRAGAVREPNPTVFQKTLGQRFYFSGPDFDYPMGEHPDDRQVAGGPLPGEKPVETKFGADMAAQGRGRTRRRLLAVHRGPSSPDNRVTIDTDGNIGCVQEHQPDRREALYHQLNSMLGIMVLHEDHLALPVGIS
jgi:hypothetical protein